MDHQRARPGAIPRQLTPLVQQALRRSRVVALCGARQVGKSTLARGLSNSYQTLDDLGVLDLARSDPTTFVRSLPPGAVIDEIQLVPDLLRVIKRVVDEDPTPGRYLITGSANLLTLPKISESLAGRMEIFELQTLAESEIEQRKENFVDQLFASNTTWYTTSPVTELSTEDILNRLSRGGYPEVLTRNDEPGRTAWFSAYLQAMMQRDIREIANITDIAAMHRILRMIASSSSRQVNLATLASTVEIPKTSLQRYLAILEQTFLIHHLPAWAGDATRRLSKAPKLFINDVGLATHQLGADTQRLVSDRNLLGTLVETFVVNEIRKQASWSITQPNLFFYRSHDGTEVDLLLEARSGERVLVEVKASATISANDVHSLRRLANDPTMQIRRGVLLYTGSSVIPAGENIHALPLSSLWS
ncbi:MAG TPA: ATP-binding protein [Candidatus Baltobacteraceae bacterium]|jgi:hypothetical protein|nr:ATP-binding protein [Candidatus Baltobacteraceae bacterium]